MRNIIILVLMTFAGLGKSIGCECGGEITVNESIKISDVVFSGRVISKILTANFDSLGYKFISDTAKGWGRWRYFSTAVVKVKVDKIYKGQYTSDTLTILTPPDGGSCGSDFQMGENYIVYGYKEVIDDIMFGLKITFDDKTFYTNACTRTNNWSTTEQNQIIKETK